MLMKIPKKFQITKRFVATIILSFALMSLPLVAPAQTPPEIKVLTDKMERGEKLTPEEQKKFNDFIKEQGEKLDQALSKLKNLGKDKPFDVKKPVILPLDETLPKFDPAAHYNNAVAPTDGAYLALVKKYNQESGAAVEDIKVELNRSFAKAETGNELSNFGMKALMSSQKDKDNLAVAMFAVTSGALKSPTDGNIASNFGVLLKNAGRYDDSLKVLLYAEKHLPQNAIVQNNLGWTIAYLGDFFTAKMRFQKAIGIDVYNINAYEGLGLLYRVEGNLPEASRYLRMCLRNGFSPVAAKNVSLIEGKGDVVIVTNPETANQDEIPGMRLSDILEFPFRDKTKGKLDLANAPDFFSASLKRVSQANRQSEFLRFHDEKREELKVLFDQLKDRQSALDDLRPAPIQNGETIVYPRSYELEAYALIDMERIFGRRHLLRYAKFIKRFQKEIKEPLVQKYSLDYKAENTEYAACGTNEDCKEAALRKFCRAKVLSISTYNPTFQGLWEKYVQEERADLRLYADLSAPWLREIENKKLNDYLNLRREIFIKGNDPLEHLGVWGDWEGLVINRWSDDCGQDPTPADAKNSLGRKLKVFPEPYGTCHVPTWKITAGIGILSFTSEATCDSVKLEFSAFGVYSGVDRKFGDKESDDVTTMHIGLGEKAALPVPGTVNLVGKLGVYISGRNGEMIDYGVEGVAKAERVSDLPAEIINKTELAKFSEIKISGASGPRDDGTSPINFTSFLDKLDN